MWFLAATYAYLGKQSEAGNVLKKYIKENGFIDYTVERVLKYYLHAFKDSKDTEPFRTRIAEGWFTEKLNLKSVCKIISPNLFA